MERWKCAKMLSSAFDMQQEKPIGPLVEFIGPILKTQVPGLTPELTGLLPEA